jgi:hypothetical protein
METPILIAQDTFYPGKPITLEGNSPITQYAVVFEDDGEIAYLYGLDKSRTETPILDALHIYNVADIKDRNVQSLIQIKWSADGLKAVLLINNYPHAAFDFAQKRGYCRTNFPPSNPKFTNHSHEWSDEILKFFA